MKTMGILAAGAILGLAGLTLPAAAADVTVGHP